MAAHRWTHWGGEVHKTEPLLKLLQHAKRKLDTDGALDMALREVFTDNGDETHRREMTRADGEIVG